MIRLLSPFFYILGFIYFILFGIFLITFSLIIGHQRLFPLLPFLTRIQLFIMGCRVKINKKIPKDGQYIIMMNHTSFADVFFPVQIARGKYTAILASWNFKIPLWKYMLKSFRAIPVYRKDRNKAIKAIKYAEETIKSLGYHIIIFPEGTRTTTGHLQPFKKGGFHMAINTKTPIIPVAVKGGFNFKPKNRWYIKPTFVEIEVLDKISVDNFSIDNIDELIQKTRRRFEKVLS